MNYNLLSSSAQGAAMPVLDEDLSFLAIQAAIELDDLIQGKSIDLIAVPQLSKMMSDSFRYLSAGGSAAALDPATATVVGEAFVASGSAGLRTVDDLINRALELARDMQSQTDPKERNGEIERMKKFCIALARCATSYRASVFGQRPRHPNRR